MDRKDQLLWLSVGVSLGISFVSFSASALPTEVCTKPTWSKNSRRDNESFLAEMRIQKKKSLNDEIFFEKGAARAMREEYESRQAREEFRDSAGLSERIEEKSRFQAMRDFAQRAVGSFSRLRLKAESQKLKKVADRTDSFFKEPVAVAVLAASLYTGRSMNIKIANGVRVQSRVELKNRQGEMTLPLAPIGLTSTVAYSQNENFTAHLSKQVVPNVTAVVSSSQKGSAQLVYSVSF